MAAARTLPPSLALTRLAAVPGLRDCFRYPLHDRDFHPLRASDDERAPLLGYYAAKPLYGALTAQGRVDRGAGFNGEIVAVFVPSPARSWQQARLLRTRMPRTRITRADGRRDWPAIRATAEAALRRQLAKDVARRG